VERLLRGLFARTPKDLEEFFKGEAEMRERAKSSQQPKTLMLK